MKREMKKRVLNFVFLIGIVFILIISMSLVIAQNVTYCCEKTTYGAWCQDAEEDECDNSLRKTPTSCDATSFCKLGCCYESSEGLCMERTSQKVCDMNNGSWADSPECDIPQCNLGCCVLGEQASFVTLTRCKKLSGFYGLATDFRKNIGSELECIAIAASQDKGACVYEVDFEKTCKFTTRGDCVSKGAIESENGTITNASVVFYKDYLCSAPELGTNCGKTKETMCVDGKDEVYFVDTCGNAANIYDASKINEPEYWRKIISKEESCKGDADSAVCGNCDYYFGSYCKETTRAGKKATYGDYICGDLNCYKTSDGENHKHGEAWCSYDGAVGEGKDSVGSKHFRHICFNGEELIEPCADFRQEVCMEDEIDTRQGKFSQAACRVNRWQECITNKEKEDCENFDKRDCYWLPGVMFTGQASAETTETQPEVFSGGNTGGFGGGITGQAIFGGDDEEEAIPEVKQGVIVGAGLGACVPDVPPGLNFWDSGEAESLCSVANARCVVVFEDKLLGGEKCVENCECLESTWAVKMNQVCAALGDCGGYVNYLGKYTDGGYQWFYNGKKTLSQGIINQIQDNAIKKEK